MAARVERIGQCVSKGALMDALYFDRAGEPEPKIVDILVCKLRRKIAGSGFVIETVWGQGYRARFDAVPPQGVMAAAWRYFFCAAGGVLFFCRSLPMAICCWPRAVSSSPQRLASASYWLVRNFGISARTRLSMSRPGVLPYSFPM